MRYGRHLRHRRHSRHERHGTKIREFLNGELTTSVPASLTVAEAALLEIRADVEGGVAPYTYVWKKGGSVVAGQTGSKLSIKSAATGDAGSYTVTVTDDGGTSVTSNACVVAVTATP